MNCISYEYYKKFLLSVADFVIMANISLHFSSWVSWMNIKNIYHSRNSTTAILKVKNQEFIWRIMEIKKITKQKSALEFRDY